MAEEKKMEERGEMSMEKGRKKILDIFGEGKIRNFLREGEIEVPEKPGPRVIGRDPAIGSVRRAMGLPVFRDELPTLIELEK